MKIIANIMQQCDKKPSGRSYGLIFTIYRKIIYSAQGIFDYISMPKIPEIRIAD